MKDPVEIKLTPAIRTSIDSLLSPNCDGVSDNGVGNGFPDELSVQDVTVVISSRF